MAPVLGIRIRIQLTLPDLDPQLCILPYCQWVVRQILLELYIKFAFFKKTTWAIVNYIQ